MELCPDRLPQSSIRKWSCFVEKLGMRHERTMFWSVVSDVFKIQNLFALHHLNWTDRVSNLATLLKLPPMMRGNVLLSTPTWSNETWSTKELWEVRDHSQGPNHRSSQMGLFMNDPSSTPSACLWQQNNFCELQRKLEELKQYTFRERYSKMQQNLKHAAFRSFVVPPNQWHATTPERKHSATYVFLNDRPTVLALGRTPKILQGRWMVIAPFCQPSTLLPPGVLAVSSKPRQILQRRWWKRLEQPWDPCTPYNCLLRADQMGPWAVHWITTKLRPKHNHKMVTINEASTDTASLFEYFVHKKARKIIFLTEDLVRKEWITWLWIRSF